MFTKEQIKYIQKLSDKYSLFEMRAMFNKKFKCNVTMKSLYQFCYRNNVKVKCVRRNQKVILKLADFFYTTFEIMNHVIIRNKIDEVKLYKLVQAEDLINRRDEFYEMFISEGTADRYWTTIWDRGRREIYPVKMKERSEL